MMECWKCAGLGCNDCKPADTLETLKESINNAIKRSDNMQGSLDALREKLQNRKKEPIPEGYAVNRAINQMIHYLCLMADDVEDLLKKGISIKERDKKELLEKLDTLTDLSKKLNL
jgi:hypothetical protein